MRELIECPGIFFAVDEMPSLLFGVGKTLLQSKINRERIRYIDITGGCRKYL